MTWALILGGALVYLAWDEHRCRRNNERVIRMSEMLTRCEPDRRDGGLT